MMAMTRSRAAVRRAQFPAHVTGLADPARVRAGRRHWMAIRGGSRPVSTIRAGSPAFIAASVSTTTSSRAGDSMRVQRHWYGSCVPLHRRWRWRNVARGRYRAVNRRAHPWNSRSRKRHARRAAGRGPLQWRHGRFRHHRDYLTGLVDRICAATRPPTAAHASTGTLDARTGHRREPWRRRTHAGAARWRGVRTGRWSDSPTYRAMRCRRRPRSTGELAGASWRAVGVSLVSSAQPVFAHHARQRAPLPAHRDGKTVARWFGGGFDLTLFYPFDETCAGIASHATCASRSAGRRA